MRIATRLFLISSSFVILTAILLPLLVWTAMEGREAKASFTLADQIKTSFLERTAFRDHYFLYREARLVDLWELNKTGSDQLLRQAETTFRREEDRQQLRQLRLAIEGTASLFRRIVRNAENLATAGEALPVYQELDRRLASQLLLRASLGISQATELRTACAQRVELAYQRLALIMGLTGGLMALVTLLVIQQSSTLIRRRLVPLHAGVKAIAAGHLAARLRLQGTDEFSELGHAIDTMADSIETATRRLQEETTQRVRLLAQAESQAHFRAWFELPLVGICITSPTKGWLEVNEHLCTMLDYERNELVQLSWVELTHPEDLAADLVQFERVLRGESEGYSLEKRFLRKGGEPFPVELAVRCVRNTAGGVEYFVALIQDITERKGAERALQASELHYRSLFNNAEIAMFRSRLDGSATLDCNERFLNLIARTRAEVIGQPSLILWEDPKAREEVTHRLKTDGFVKDMEFGLLRPSGELRYCLASMRYYPETECIEGSVQDLTEQRQAEAEGAKFQAQLQQAQKLESLGLLAGGVAHDMNNVLGAILGLASAQLEAPSPANPARQAFQIIIKAAERGGKMVRSLLNFARTSPFEEQDLDLNQLLQEEVSQLLNATLSRIQLKLDLAADLRTIRGDASALTHALMNLCINAMDAMPNSGTLTLRTANVDNDWIELRVEDTGSGMSREVLDKALDPFFTTKGVGKGTGLGLSLVHSSVTAHRGQMEIQSDPGQGTCVRLRLPALKRQAIAPKPVPSTAPEVAGGGLHVLLVDDDELVRTAIQMILKGLHHSATMVASGEEALAQLQAGLQPDVVLLDMNMPGLGGSGTLPRLRTLRPGVPVFLITGRADQAALDLVAAHPGVNLLAKPFSLEDLQQRLRSCARPGMTPVF